MKKYLLVSFFVLTWFICVGQNNVTISQPEELFIEYNEITQEFLFEVPGIIASYEPVVVDENCLTITDDCIILEHNSGTFELSVQDCWRIVSYTYTDVKYTGEVWRHVYDFINHKTLINE
jgi:hypothetical protein